MLTMIIRFRVQERERERESSVLRVIMPTCLHRKYFHSLIRHHLQTSLKGFADIIMCTRMDAK